MKKNNFINTLKFVSVILCISACFSSCKKDNNEPDDPNIIYTNFNKTINVSLGVTIIDSLDFNLDTKIDFSVFVGISSTGDTAAAYLIGESAGPYIDSTQKISFVFQTRALDKGQVPRQYSTAKEWATLGIIGYKQGSSNMGFAGAGDKFIPLLFNNPINGKFHYGWIRINLSSDYKTYKVIDGAYNLIPETPIKMGAQ
ncbi:MAG TPA: hypothetical protein PK431_15320 [Chitinophagales bacterium]|nr:hypothetical protein [Chitinophagales bacterium]